MGNLMHKSALLGPVTKTPLRVEMGCSKGVHQCVISQVIRSFENPVSRISNSCISPKATKGKHFMDLNSRSCVMWMLILAVMSFSQHHTLLNNAESGLLTFICESLWHTLNKYVWHCSHLDCSLEASQHLIIGLVWKCQLHAMHVRHVYRKSYLDVAARWPCLWPVLVQCMYKLCRKLGLQPIRRDMSWSWEVVTSGAEPNLAPTKLNQLLQRCRGTWQSHNRINHSCGSHGSLEFSRCACAHHTLDTLKRTNQPFETNAANLKQHAWGDWWSEYQCVVSRSVKQDITTSNKGPSLLSWK